MQKIKRSIVLALLLCTLGQSASAEEVFDVNLASGTPLVEALRALSLRANKNVVINGDLQGTVALHLKGTTFAKALDCLALINGFTYLENKGVVLISPVEKMSQVATYNVKHLDLENLKKDVALFLPENKINVDKDQSTITVDGNISQLNKVKTHLAQHDIAQKQINVQATVLEVSRTKAREMGMDYVLDAYNKGTAGIKWLAVASHEEINGLGNVLASPSVTVFNGKKANILIGDKVPVFTSSETSRSVAGIERTITVEYKDIGVKLEVTPRVNDEAVGTVSMKIKPSISAISQWVETGNNKAPQISTREAETELRIKTGETIYLGGLLKDSDLKSIKAIPFLSKLPVLGELFKRRTISKEKTEIIIAITPRIVEDVKGVPQFTAPGDAKAEKEALANGDKIFKENSRELLADFTSKATNKKRRRTKLAGKAKETKEVRVAKEVQVGQAVLPKVPPKVQAKAPKAATFRQKWDNLWEEKRKPTTTRPKEQVPMTQDSEWEDDE